jgi:hypothetical protein
MASGNGGISIGADALKVLVPLIVSATVGLGFWNSSSTTSALSNEDAGFSRVQLAILCDLNGNPRSRWCQNFPGPPMPQPDPPPRPE